MKVGMKEQMVFIGSKVGDRDWCVVCSWFWTRRDKREGEAIEKTWIGVKKDTREVS